MKIEISKALIEDELLLANLLNLYLYDFSEWYGNAPDPEGRFEYEWLPSYFEDPKRTPLLIRADGEPAGFALVKEEPRVGGPEETWDLTEFFIVRGLRRRSIGLQAASFVFARFPGPWQVRAMDRNVGAAHFWTRAIRAHTADAFTITPFKSEEGTAWQVFRFLQE